MQSIYTKIHINLEKISRKLKFGTDVPYTLLTQHKKIPAHITLENATIHNGGFSGKFYQISVLYDEILRYYIDIEYFYGWEKYDKYVKRSLNLYLNVFKDINIVFFKNIKNISFIFIIYR